MRAPVPSRRDVHRRLAGLIVESRLCVGDAVAGQYDLLLHQIGRAVAVVEQLVAERHLPAIAACNDARIAVLLVHHPHFQGRGAAEDVLGLRRVLHAGQLHDDTVGARLLHDRLGHAQLVDAIAQGGEVLLQGEVLDAFCASGLRVPSPRIRRPRRRA